MLKFGQKPNCPFLTADSLADNYFSRNKSFFFCTEIGKKVFQTKTICHKLLELTKLKFFWTHFWLDLNKQKAPLSTKFFEPQKK